MIYDIANLRVFIDNKHEFTTKFCQEYLSDDQLSPVHLTARATEEDIEKEREASQGFSDGYLENICIYRDLCLQLPTLDRFLMHAAILSCDGEGFAFLGRSGAGKTTHTSLWLKYVNGAKIVNGDKPILSFDGQTFIAYGTPWMGKERRGCKEQVPLKGLCFIEQAKENKIQKLTPSETAMRLFSQLLLPTDEANAAKTLEIADKLVQLVPAYVLYCDISENAVKISYESLANKKYHYKGKEENEN